MGKIRNAVTLSALVLALSTCGQERAVNETPTLQTENSLKGRVENFIRDYNRGNITKKEYIIQKLYQNLYQKKAGLVKFSYDNQGWEGFFNYGNVEIIVIGSVSVFLKDDQKSSKFLLEKDGPDLYKQLSGLPPQNLRLPEGYTILTGLVHPAHIETMLDALRRFASHGPKFGMDPNSVSDIRNKLYQLGMVQGDF